MPRRPSNAFGSPNQNDGTAHWDRVVEIASDRAAEQLQNVGQTYPRPVGSRRMTDEHAVAEMQLMKDYPDLIAQMAAENEWSLETFVGYLEKMHRKLGQ